MSSIVLLSSIVEHSAELIAPNTSDKLRRSILSTLECMRALRLKSVSSSYLSCLLHMSSVAHLQKSNEEKKVGDLFPVLINARTAQWLAILVVQRQKTF